MIKAINITDLTRAAIEHDDTLRMMPFMVLQEEMDNLGINLLQVDGEHKIVIFQRKGGIAKPYVSNISNNVSETELGKVIERSLIPKTCYTALKDNILNYKTKRVVSNKSEKVSNTDKTHPHEVEIIATKIRTVGEDILDALFFAERDEADNTPMGMFNGFNTLIDDEITAGDISLAKGNLFNTGALVTPIDSNDMEAFDKLVAFIRAANPYLRRNGVLYLTNDALFAAQDALGNKLKYKNALEFEVFVNHLRGLTQAPKLDIRTSPILGMGSRMMLTTPGNFDFGIGTKGDTEFVQVRDVYEDPNIVQFWMQWESGCRVNNIHPKEFLINDQVNLGTGLSGDYS